METGLKTYDDLVSLLSKFPSIGKKSAQRLAYHVLKQDERDVQELSNALVGVKEAIRLCSECFGYSEASLCRFCLQEKRQKDILCVVESPIDVFSVEDSGQFYGRYHVLHGRLSPLDGVGPSDIKVKELLDRCEMTPPREVILAMNPDVEGDATALYLARVLSSRGIETTRIAMGIPLGGSLEYIDQVTLGRAISERRRFSEGSDDI